VPLRGGRKAGFICPGQTPLTRTGRRSAPTGPGSISKVPACPRALCGIAFGRVPEDGLGWITHEFFPLDKYWYNFEFYPEKAGTKKLRVLSVCHGKYFHIV